MRLPITVNAWKVGEEDDDGTATASASGSDLRPARARAAWGAVIGQDKPDSLSRSRSACVFRRDVALDEKPSPWR